MEEGAYSTRRRRSEDDEVEQATEKLEHHDGHLEPLGREALDVHGAVQCQLQN